MRPAGRTDGRRARRRCGEVEAGAARGRALACTRTCCARRALTPTPRMPQGAEPQQVNRKDEDGRTALHWVMTGVRVCVHARAQAHPGGFRHAHRRALRAPVVPSLSDSLDAPAPVSLARPNAQAAANKPHASKKHAECVEWLLQVCGLRILAQREWSSTRSTCTRVCVRAFLCACTPTHTHSGTHVRGGKDGRCGRCGRASACGRRGREIGMRRAAGPRVRFKHSHFIPRPTLFRRPPSPPTTVSALFLVSFAAWSPG